MLDGADTPRGPAMSTDELLDQLERQRPGTEATVEGCRAQRSRMAQELYEARLRSGLTQRDLAALSGIKQPDISAIENGLANPTEATWARLGKPLGLRPGLVADDDQLSA